MQATARQAKAARQADADSGASGWDKLSDVDYWAELAADKPLAADAAASSDSSRSPRGRADQKRDARSAPRGEPAQLPVRQRSQSRSAPAPAGRLADQGQTEQIDVRAARGGGRYGTEPATQGLAALARLADQPPAPSQPAVPGLRSPSGPRPAGGQRPMNGRPSGGQRPVPPTERRALPAGPLPATGQRPSQPPLPQAPAAPISHSGGQARPPQPLDDDPLTSPSFPAINTSDSRSYRTRQPSSSQRGSSQPHGAPRTGGHSSSGNGTGEHRTGGYSEPAQPYSPYPATPDRSTSRPNGYPVQPAAASAAGSPYAPSPVANPYGSYVNAPQPGYSGAGTPATPPPTPHLDPAAYGSGYAAGQQAVAGANWYASTQDASQAADGYLPAPASGNGLSYESPTYQGGHSAQPGGHAPGYLPAISAAMVPLSRLRSGRLPGLPRLRRQWALVRLATAPRHLRLAPGLTTPCDRRPQCAYPQSR